MSLVDQSRNQTDDQSRDQKPWLYRPGQTGCAQGRGAPKARIEAQLAEYVAAFQNVHHRPPAAGERTLMKNAATLAIKLEKSLAAADVALLSNALARLLRRLRLDGVAAQPRQHLTERERARAAVAAAVRKQNGVDPHD